MSAVYTNSSIALVPILFSPHSRTFSCDFFASTCSHCYILLNAGPVRDVSRVGGVAPAGHSPPGGAGHQSEGRREPAGDRNHQGQSHDSTFNSEAHCICQILTGKIVSIGGKVIDKEKENCVAFSFLDSCEVASHRINSQQ